MHYEQVKTNVEQLKRKQKYEPALKILTKFIKRYEAGKEHPRSTSWAYQQTAIIYRKEKRYDDEIAIIHQFIHKHLITSKSSRNLVKRLDRAYVLAGLAEKRTINGQTTIFVLNEQRIIGELPIFILHGLMVDVETTGLSKKDEIIELGAVLFKYSQYTGEILSTESTYTGLRQPRVKISQGAARVHNISKKELKGKRLNNKEVKHLIKNADILLAHNASFDYRFLASLYPSMTNKIWYCTMNGIPWKKKGHKSKGLANLLNDLGIQNSTTHRGLADAYAALSLIQQIDPETDEPYMAEMLVKPYHQPKTNVRFYRQPPKNKDNRKGLFSKFFG